MYICLKVSLLDICRAPAASGGFALHGEFNIENIRSIYRRMTNNIDRYRTAAK